MHIRTINVGTFRGLQNVCLNDLKTLNVITGDNSSGKTAILEAVYMMFALGPQNIQRFPTKFRPQTGQANPSEGWNWLYPEGSLGKALMVDIITNDNGEYSLRSAKTGPSVALSKKGQQSMQFGPTGGAFPSGWPKISAPELERIDYFADSESYNHLAATIGGEERFLELIRGFDSRVRKIRYLKLAQFPLVYVDIGLKNLIPVSQMGEAFARVFSLYLELLSANSEIILLDEVESGIHVDKMETVWKGLAAIAERLDVQIICTTHSRECLKSAFIAVESKETTATRHFDLKFVAGEIQVRASESLLEAFAS